jgi:hypothetical protein
MSAPLRETFATTAWQRRLLPLMTGMLIALGVVTIASNIYQAHVVQKHIQATRQFDLTPLWQGVEGSRNLDAFAFARWRTIATLEAQAIENRYHQASAIVMTRLYLIFPRICDGRDARTGRGSVYPR